MTLGSCGLFKKTNKHIDKSESVTRVEHSEVKVGNVESKEVDRGTVVTETERIEERKRDGGKRVVTGELKPGRNVLMDSVLKELVLVFDSLTNRIDVEVTIPPVEERVVTKERKEEKKDQERKEIRKDSAVIRDDRFSTVSSEEIKKESKPDYNWIWYVGVLIIVLWLLWKRYRWF
ncbi:MAG TPA: hypothetical protein VNR38_00805 [Ureibacillus sp.]|nr:hypothetical protein [Ureibacillus sp.]